MRGYVTVGIGGGVDFRLWVLGVGVWVRKRAGGRAGPEDRCVDRWSGKKAGSSDEVNSGRLGGIKAD